jgi:hypothetical protein
MPVTRLLKDFGFGISDFGFPAALPRQWDGWAGIENSKFKIQNLDFPPHQPGEFCGRAGGIQNSKFKIQNSTLIGGGSHQLSTSLMDLP